MTSNYLKVPIKRLYHGFASVRSTQLEKAKREGKGLQILYQGKQMTISHDDLERGVKNKEVFKSKHNYFETYSLVDFDWHEDLTIQQPLFE